MNNLDSQLDEQLHASAAGLNFGPGDVDRVMGRARTRGRRRQRAFATVAVVAVLSGAVAGAKLSQGGAARPRTVAAGPTTAVAPAGLKRGDAGLVWQLVDPHSALSYANSVTSGGALYALSTAPGVTNPNADSGVARQLYRSSDGVDWAALRGPADAFVADLSASGDQLYAVGTGSATGAVGAALSPLVVDSTGNGGTTWRQVRLPVDLAAIQAGTLSANRFEAIMKVASSAKGVLVVARVAVDLNVPKYLPRGVTAPNGWVVTNSGVDLLGPINSPACPAGMTTKPTGSTSATISTQQAVSSSAGPTGPTVCFSANAATTAAEQRLKGGQPTLVAPEANHPVTRSLTWAQLGVSGDLKHAVSGEPFVFFAADGKSFRPVTLLNPSHLATDAQVAAGTGSFALAVSSADGQERIWQSTDGLVWAPTPAPPADLGSPSAVGYLAGRLTVVSGYDGVSPSMAVLRAGVWSEVSLTAALGPTAGAAAVHMGRAAIGPFGMAVLVTVDRGQPAERLLVSRDGITWSDRGLDQLASSNFVDVTNIVVTANRFVVTALLQNGQTPQPEAVVIGTAR